ncbi:hypothetical protein ABIE08_000054 [Kaistia defluvii]|uniref:Lipoprotein n=2 Tax=Kaistiaceae TaxID=2831111 RepID=A0ABV2QUP4_9HYPH
MHGSSFGGSAGPRRLMALLSVATLAGLVSACSSVADGSSGGGNVVNNAIFGAPNKNLQNATIVSAANFGADVDCPPVAIKPGTEEFKVFAAGKPDPLTGANPPVVYQATIIDTARECRKVEGGVNIKLGIKGRVASGPAGKAQTINVPIRIVVMEGRDKVLKSDLVKLPVVLSAPTFASDFSRIDESITVPLSENNTDFHVYVGFDERAAGGKGRS